MQVLVAILQREAADEGGMMECPLRDSLAVWEVHVVRQSAREAL